MLYHQRLFFSSRRRHTRWPRDWSSDVCSSDLNSARNSIISRRVEKALWPDGETTVTPGGHTACSGDFFGDFGRSEERRVGKECSCRWSGYDYSRQRDRSREVTYGPRSRAAISV